MKSRGHLFRLWALLLATLWGGVAFGQGNEPVQAVPVANGLSVSGVFKGNDVEDFFQNLRDVLRSGREVTLTQRARLLGLGLWGRELAEASHRLKISHNLFEDSFTLKGEGSPPATYQGEKAFREGLLAVEDLSMPLATPLNTGDEYILRLTLRFDAHPAENIGKNTEKGWKKILSARAWADSLGAVKELWREGKLEREVVYIAR